MMPSRGWHFAKGNAPRLFQLQCRNLSSTSSRRIPRPSSCNGIYAQSKTPYQWKASSISPISIAVRHASTTPQTNTTEQAISTASAPPSTASTTGSPSYPDLDTVTFDDIDLNTAADIANVPEKIGYLKEIGLDYGWGPTSMIEWVLEHVHIYSGLPWWGSIAVTAALIRVVLFPLYLKSSDMMARQQALVSVTKPITDKITAAQRAGDQQAMMAAWTQLSTIRKRAGISMFSQFQPMIFQGVIAYCGFKLIRAMAYLPVPGLKTGGFLWLSDLTLSDPYIILPAIMAGSIHLLIRMGGESGVTPTDSMQQGMVKFMKWGMPVLVLFGTGWLPGAVAVWFSAGGLLGIGQSLALQRPAVRNFFGIAPMYKPGKDEGKALNFAQSLMEGMRPETKATETGGRGAGGAAGAGKNTGFMKPTYQSPNIRHSSSKKGFKSPGDYIDVKATTKNPKPAQSTQSSPSPQPSQPSRPPNQSIDPEMIQPGTKSSTSASSSSGSGGSGGVLAQASQSWGNLKKWGREKMGDTEEQREKRRIANRKDAAEAYEKRAQQAKLGRGRKSGR